MRSRVKTLSWLLAFHISLAAVPAPGRAQDRVPAPASVDPVPTQQPDTAVLPLEASSEEAAADAQANQANQQPGGAVPSPQQTTTQATPPTQTTVPTTAGRRADAPATTQAQLTSPVSTRPFTENLIVLPVDHLLGDWWGVRTRLEDEGIAPSLTFESNIAGNPVGGMRHGFTEADNLGLNVNFDLDKLYGLKGGTFYVSMSQRSGANLSKIDIGNTFTLSRFTAGKHGRSST
jgi:hypothetical protein